MRNDIPEISIITPCFNEEGNVLKCHESLKKVMAESLPDVTYEHIFADNCSKDDTVKLIRTIAANDLHVKLIVNSKNIGAPRNIYRALARARGKVVIPMLPADLQDPPSAIPEFYREWQKGYLIVFGKRAKRQEILMMRLLRTSYYRIIKKFAATDIPINSGDFMMIDRKVVNVLLDLKEKNPYIRGLVAQVGAKSTSVQYEFGKRQYGKSKATPFVLLDLAINGLISTSRLPARLALLTGFFLSFLGVLMGLWSTLAVLFDSSQIGTGIPTIIVTLFFIGGIQLFFLGLIGEYVLSIHGQIRPDPDAFDLETIGFGQKDEN